jgi:hypothetical protein
MRLLDMRGGGFLFEACPSLFPEGELTETEVVLWELYYSEKQQILGN